MATRPDNCAYLAFFSGGEYLAFFSGCTSQAATRCAMMKRALKVPHGVVVDRCQHIPPRLHHHATRRAVGHAAESTHGPGGPILLTDHRAESVDAVSPPCTSSTCPDALLRRPR